jgi:hypothetical protein
MNIRSLILMFALVALVSGCQTTSIRSAWFDTDFTGPPFRKIVVVGITDSVTEGRVFEDVFALYDGWKGGPASTWQAATVDQSNVERRGPSITTEAMRSGASGLPVFTG